MEAHCRPLLIDSDRHELIGILESPTSGKKRGIVIVTGGPQYRVGSHRQFVLLARTLAHNGYPVLRFDYHGMGDSSGPKSDFLDCGADIAAAIAAFEEESGVEEVVLLGLCDAASASLMYVVDGSPVAGMILINPWVRTEHGLARAHLRHYYLQRLVSGEFVRKVFSGELRIRKVFGDFIATVGKSLAGKASNVGRIGSESARINEQDFRELMLEGLAKFNRPVLILLSGDDLTANEFVDFTKRDRRWRKLLRHSLVTQRKLEDGDHTFSTKKLRSTIEQWMLDWLKTW